MQKESGESERTPTLMMNSLTNKVKLSTAKIERINNGTMFLSVGNSEGYTPTV